MTEPELAPGDPHEASGDPRVDEMIAALAAVADAPPAEQTVPLAEADRVLRETLDSIGDV